MFLFAPLLFIHLVQYLGSHHAYRHFSWGKKRNKPFWSLSASWGAERRVSVRTAAGCRDCRRSSSHASWELKKDSWKRHLELVLEKWVRVFQGGKKRSVLNSEDPTCGRAPSGEKHDAGFRPKKQWRKWQTKRVKDLYPTLKSPVRRRMARSSFLSRK